MPTIEPTKRDGGVPITFTQGGYRMKLIVADEIHPTRPLETKDFERVAELLPIGILTALSGPNPQGRSQR